MTLFALKYFRRDVIWSTANSSFSFSIKFKFSCQTKITDLYLHLIVKEQITEF
jgi:hypothetical protein